MRRFLLWLFFLGSLCVLGSLAWLARRSLSQTPRAAYEAGARAAFGPDRDPALAFRQLEFALRGAEAARDRELLAEVLKTRGRLFLELDSLPRARQDYEEVLRRYKPDDLESELALAGVLLLLDEDGEATRRVRSVIDRDPDNGRALAILGELELRYARTALTEAERLIDLSLAPTEREQAKDLLRRASSLPATDARRLQLVDALREAFPVNDERLLQSVLSSLETATTRQSAAREALVASFASAPSTSTLIDFLDLLVGSGRRALALDFALSAANHPAATADQGFLQRCTQLLTGNGQPHLAVETIARHLGDNVPGPGFYQRWCQLLYGEAQWEDLIVVATAFAAAGDGPQRSQALCYAGLAHAALERWEEAQKFLRPYLGNDPVEPFPDAVALAWMQLARCYREEERTAEESGALRATLNKGRGRLPDEGDLWLRLFELGMADPSPTKDLEELERILTYGMCRMPERLEELMPRWQELGQRNLDAARIDLDEVFAEMLSVQSYAASDSAGPYEKFELAQLFAAREMHAGVLQQCTSILTQYPGFVPAEDLELASRRAMGDTLGCARLLMGRLLRSPADRPAPELVRSIDALGAGVLDADQRLTLMRRDPAGLARQRMLQSLAASREFSTLAASLLAVPDDEISGQDRLYAGSLLLEMGHAEELGIVLDDLEPDPSLQARATGLRLRAALAKEDWESFDGLLSAALTAEDVDGSTLVALLDHLQARGQVERMRALALWIDSQPLWRNGSSVLRLSQSARRAGLRQDAEEGLLRADAFLTDGSPELGYLIDTVAARDWGRLPARVLDLRSSGFQPNEVASLLLDILAEDHKAAALRITEVGARNPKDPLWALARPALADLMGLDLDEKVMPGWSESSDQQTLLALRGTAEAERDPREILTLVLASEHPQWRSWALAEFEARLGTGGPSLWHGYLAGRNWMRSGDSERARARAEELVAAWPHFQAGWDLLEAADREREQRLEGQRLASPPDEISWVRWRQREVLGALPGDPSLEHWMSALVAESEGDRSLAQRALARAIELRPEDPRFHLTQARIYAADVDWAPALTAMGRAIKSANEPAFQRWVAERALDLHRAILAKPASAHLKTLVREQRERLDQDFPNDPLVAIELARSDVASWTSSPDRGFANAERRLERFRQRSDNRPLEDLRPGATRMWFEFLLQYDSRLAQIFAIQELRLRPGVPDLWRMFAEANEVAGEYRTAIGLRRFLQAALPSPVDARALVHLEARLGRDRENFERAFTSCLVQDNQTEPDVDLQLARARFFIESGEKGWPEAREILERLWEEHYVAQADPPREGDEVAVDETPGVSPLNPEGTEPEPAQEDAPASEGVLAGEEEPKEPPAAVDTTLSRRIGAVYVRLLGWGGRPEDAERLLEVSEHVLTATEDELERQVLTALRSLFAPPAEPGAAPAAAPQADPTGG